MGLLAAVRDSDCRPTSADQQLLLAAWQGDAAQVREAIRLGVSLLSVFRVSGGPAPHAAAAAAAEQGPLDQLQQLMEAGTGLSPPSFDGCTALHLAAHNGDVEVVEVLLASGARWDLPGKQRQLPLHVASFCNHVGVVQLLLHASRAPAHVDAATRNGDTPLSLACSQGHGDVVSLLLAAGADPGITLGANGPPLLHLVARAGNVSVLQQLLAAMAVGQGTANVNAVGPDGLTAVQWALTAGHLGCAEALIAAGADVDRVPGVETRYGRTTHFQCTLLHWAVSQGLAAAVPLLASPSNWCLTWHRGHTPLQLALGRQDVAVSRALLAAVPPAERNPEWFSSAMSFASQSKHPAIRALVPAMVRDQCLLYKQVLQGGQQRQHQKQGGQQQEGTQQRDAAAVFEALTGGLCDVLTHAAVDAEGDPAVADQGVACCRVVLEELGTPAAGSCLQGLLHLVEAIDRSVGRGQLIRQVLWVLHSGWLEGLEPLLQVRRQVVHPLQLMVAQGLRWQQQQQHEGAHNVAAAAAQLGRICMSGGTQASASCLDPEQLAVAAAGAGQWEEFVSHLEQLTVRQPVRACEVLCEVAAAQGPGWCPELGRLCEALLSAWWAARQTAAAAAAQEVVNAVVEAVMASRSAGGCSAAEAE